MHYYIADPPSRVDDGERVIERLTTNEDDPSPVDDMQAQIKGEGWLGFFLGMCPLIYTKKGVSSPSLSALMHYCM